jgi:hypothetical protein
LGQKERKMGRLTKAQESAIELKKNIVESLQKQMQSPDPTIAAMATKAMAEMTTAAEALEVQKAALKVQQRQLDLRELAESRRQEKGTSNNPSTAKGKLPKNVREHPEWDTRSAFYLAGKTSATREQWDDIERKVRKDIVNGVPEPTEDQIKDRIAARQAEQAARAKSEQDERDRIAQALEERRVQAEKEAEAQRLIDEKQDAEDKKIAAASKRYLRAMSLGTVEGKVQAEFIAIGFKQRGWTLPEIKPMSQTGQTQAASTSAPIDAPIDSALAAKIDETRRRHNLGPVQEHIPGQGYGPRENLPTLSQEGIYIQGLQRDGDGPRLVDWVSDNEKPDEALPS